MRYCDLFCGHLAQNEKLMSVFSHEGNPDSETEELDRAFLETVTIRDREYQKYAIDRRIYFEPVDEVRQWIWL